MIGPDGTQGRKVPIAEVLADLNRVRVVMGAPPEHFPFHAFLTVTMDWGYRNGEPSLNIHGGNTNDGDVTRFKEAITVYTNAVEVAERLIRVTTEPDAMFSGYENDMLPPVAASFPDYMLAAFLRSKGCAFFYMRDKEPESGETRAYGDPVPMFGLASLREKCVAVAQAGVTA